MSSCVGCKNCEVAPPEKRVRTEAGPAAPKKPCEREVTCLVLVRWGVGIVSNHYAYSDAIPEFAMKLLLGGQEEGLGEAPDTIDDTDPEEKRDLNLCGAIMAFLVVEGADVNVDRVRAICRNDSPEHMMHLFGAGALTKDAPRDVVRMIIIELQCDCRYDKLLRN
jgi:hypothetical protein